MDENRFIKTYFTCLVGILIVALPVNPLMAQKKKDISSAGIGSKKEWNYSYTNGTEKKYLEAEYEYDKKGNTIAEKLYDENGTIVKHKTYKFDAEGNEVLKVTYNSEGQIVEREETKYKNGLKVEKCIYGLDGKLKSKKVFEYNID